MSTPAAPQDMSRRKQFIQTYKMTKETDTKIGLWLLLAFVVGAAVGFAVMYLLPGPDLLMAIPAAILLGVLAALITFTRRAQKAAYARMHGQQGSAAAALSMLRKGWKTEPMVAFNKQQDIVHRVVGPPGIVLIGEGNHNRVRQLLITEKRRHERVVSDVPVREVICGDGEDEVPLDKLVKHVTKLGKDVKPAEMTDILGRLKAIDASRGKMPLPKGPMPTSMKGQRGNLRGR